MLFAVFCYSCCHVFFFFFNKRKFHGLCWCSFCMAACLVTCDQRRAGVVLHSYV